MIWAPPLRRLVGVRGPRVEQRLQLVPGEGSFPGIGIGSWMCTEVFHSWITCTGCVPKRCSHSVAHW